MSDQQQQKRPPHWTEDLFNVLPGVGSVYNGIKAVEAASEGNVGGALWHGANVIPAVHHLMAPVHIAEMMKHSYDRTEWEANQPAPKPEGEEEVPGPYKPPQMCEDDTQNNAVSHWSD